MNINESQPEVTMFLPQELEETCVKIKQKKIKIQGRMGEKKLLKTAYLPNE